MNNYGKSTAPNDSKAPAKHGCWFYGCITVLVLTGLLIAGSYYGIRKALNIGKQILIEYSEEFPRELPTSSLEAEELAALEDRVSAFMAALEARKAAQVSLSGPEINALIDHLPELQALKGLVHLTIVDGKVGGQVSIPLERLWATEELAGRYLNGSAQFTVQLRPEEDLIIKLQDLELKGEPLPEPVMEEFLDTNLAAEWYQIPDNRAKLKQLDRIKIVQDKIIIVAKGN